MTNNHEIVESSYRQFYGRLFTSLTNIFGTKYVEEIEDALQNTFYKSIKNWKNEKSPNDRLNWLFIVAKNDVLNQIKKKGILIKLDVDADSVAQEKSIEDLRLQTILYLASCETVSSKAKVIFILKNIFGLNIREISACTLIAPDAIYKSITRTKKEFSLLQLYPNTLSSAITITDVMGRVVEEILYGVFTIGFDSFNEKTKAIINEDLCLEALALAKMLKRKHPTDTVKNLLAVFCFHLARVPAKFENRKLIPFFKQDRSKWDMNLVHLGFKYLEKPPQLNKYYLEALITSKHMTSDNHDKNYWNDIANLYEVLIKFSSSPITKLNYCYCLCQSERWSEAKKCLVHVESELPKQHIYLNLVKASLVEDTDKAKSTELIKSVLENINQKIRTEYIFENLASAYKN
ncbi:DUF6596 domain-containing protein [Spongiivirga citrea]|uniref:RNA polymerase n=1 Tax=Spongiivirga citrea TaxID=1481457 RepID=A0A6M0CFK3_9FLAO|nr:DUF6596 domain-containing protein [Spongiivirga citrea]NER16605.1 RNA polymerase [Spongiivirga citrea]